MNDQTINILVVSSKYPPEYAGSGLRAHNTYKRLSSKYNIRFDVLTSSITSNTSEEYEFDRVMVKKIAGKFMFPWLERFREGIAKRIISAFKFRLNYVREALPSFKHLYTKKHIYDLYHIFGNVAVTSAAISFAKLYRKPMLIELVTDMKDPHQYEPFPLKIFSSMHFPENSTIICISERLKKLCNNYGYHNNVWCRPNPVNEKKFFVARNRKYDLRQQNSIFTENDIVLVNISKFMPLKNQVFLIDVMKFLPHNFKLLIAGPVVTEGPLYERDKKYLDGIKSKIKEYGLNGRVQINTEFVENVDEFIKMSDVYVFPTHGEGLGTPMLESIACGVPVVTSFVPGITDSWIKDGLNGYISTMRPEIFAEKVKDASKIPEAVLDRESENIKSIASTERIDSEYFRLIKEMVKNN
jgi:glycosyltransferase involved in cell wall biosynthesis